MYHLSFSEYSRLIENKFFTHRLGVVSEKNLFLRHSWKVRRLLGRGGGGVEIKLGFFIFFCSITIFTIVIIATSRPAGGMGRRYDCLSVLRWPWPR